MMVSVCFLRVVVVVVFVIIVAIKVVFSKIIIIITVITVSGVICDRFLRVLVTPMDPMSV